MQRFEARGTEWLKHLEGVELADFWQRAVAFIVDIVFAIVLLMLVLTLIGAVIWFIRAAQGRPEHVAIGINRESEMERVLTDLIVPVLYFGLTAYFGNGQTPGKRLTGIRSVSLVHEHLTLWHSIERALGYGAAALEFGFGFAQFFIHPFRRTVQDRIAETIVVKEHSFRALPNFHAGSVPPAQAMADVSQV